MAQTKLADKEELIKILDQTKVKCYWCRKWKDKKDTFRGSHHSLCITPCTREENKPTYLMNT